MFTRFACAAVLVASLSVGALPVAAAQTTPEAPVLDVANPSAGDTLLVGKTVIEGIAFDPGATQGAGIDKVTFFLDASREQGGEVLGDATLGTPNPLAAPDAQFATAGFTFTMPVVHMGSHQLYVYGHSTVTGKERVVAIPFVVGQTDAPKIEEVTPASTTWVLP
jgi:hypothetical protein